MPLFLFVQSAKSSIMSTHCNRRSYSALFSRRTRDSHCRRFPLETRRKSARVQPSSHESPHLAITRQTRRVTHALRIRTIPARRSLSPHKPHHRTHANECDLRFRVGEKEARARGRRLIVSFCSFIPERHAACRLIDRNGRGTRFNDGS